MPMTILFYAAMDDLTDLSRRLFEVPGIKLFEEYSAPDQPDARKPTDSYRMLLARNGRAGNDPLADI